MDPQTFQAARGSDRRAKNRVRVPMNETLEWPKSFRHKKSWPTIGPGKNLAIFLRSRLSDAVDARRVPFTNRFPHREELRLAMQMRAARYVKYFVILILRYCDRSGTWRASSPLAGCCWSCVGTISLLAENTASPSGTAAAAVSVQAKKVRREVFGIYASL